MSHGGHCAAFPSDLRIKAARKPLTFASVASLGNVTIMRIFPDASESSAEFQFDDAIRAI